MRNYKVTNKKRTELFVVVTQYVLTLIIGGFLLRKIQTNGVIENLVVSVLFFFLLPTFVLKSIFKTKLKRFYFNFNLNASQLFLAAAALMVILLATIFMVKFGQEKYILVSPWIRSSITLVLLLDLLILIPLSWSQEFFFRGFLQKTFSKNFGPSLAIFLQALAFGFYQMVFLRGFEAETLMATGWLLFLNLILGVLVFYSRSLFCCFLVHWIYLWVLDFWVIIKIQ